MMLEALKKFGVLSPRHLRRQRQMAKVGRNDPCPCGSGKKYKRCCIDGARAASLVVVRDRAAFEAAMTPEGMAAERERYAKTWSEADAEAFARDGHYAWMAAQVTGCHRVLEIGTGDGRGTIELLRSGHQVVSVDENPACLRRAVDNIDRAGFPVQVELRGSVTAGEGGYRIAYRPVPAEWQGDGAFLIEGDTLNDQDLLRWLKAQLPFDAVVCWLMGSHLARGLNLALPRDPANIYRLRVQNGLYVLADAVLRGGGALNIIDRASIGLTDKAVELLRVDAVQSHREQASPTSLRVGEQVSTRAYEPPDGVKMEFTLGLSGLVPDDVTIGLQSVLAWKP